LAKAPPHPPVGTKADGRKAPTTSAVGDDSGYTSAHAIDLFTSSMSEEEAIPLERCRKRACTSASLKANLKTLEAAIVEGTVLQLACFLVGGTLCDRTTSKMRGPSSRIRIG
jgi:hypothetical protein